MYNLKFKIVVTSIILLVIFVFLSTVSFSQSLGSQTANYSVVAASLDTYDASTAKWSNNSWVEAFDGTAITVYDRAIALFRGGDATVDLFMIDVTVNTEGAEYKWFAMLTPQQYAKIRIYESTSGKTICTIDYLNGTKMYLHLVKQ